MINRGGAANALIRVNLWIRAQCHPGIGARTPLSAFYDQCYTTILGRIDK